MASKGERIAIGYLRVSTERQATEGVSLAAQRARIEAWAQANGYRLVDVYVDAGLSGGRADNRPALQQALAEACKRRGALVVYSLSRLARSVQDTLTVAGRLDRAGADLVSLSELIDTTSAAGKMMFRMLAVLSEFERDLVSERTAVALAHKAGKGERVSRFAPIGHRVEKGRIVADEGEQAALRRVRELRANGKSIRAIVAQLNDEGTPCRGSRWHLSTVQAALRSAA